MEAWRPVEKAGHHPVDLLTEWSVVVNADRYRERELRSLYKIGSIAFST